MSRNDFIDMIGDKVQINRQMIGEVYELIDIFPYFQSAHMLLLKGLQNTADVKFEKQLRNSAIHIADREVLYYLLKTINTPVSEKRKPDNEVTVSAEEISYDHQQTVIESARNSEQLISEIENDQDNRIRSDDESAQLHSHSILVSSESEILESEEVMLVTDEEPSFGDEKVFYMDPGFSVPDNSDLLELDNDEAVTGPGKETNGLMQTSVDNGSVNDNKLTQSTLIDKFILTNPRIEPVRSPLKTPLEDISKPFTENEGGFVTETLARIYVNQGYYSKAIDIYEKLSLKFPEKISYFASQIELVKVYLKK